MLNFQQQVMLTALYQASDLEQDLHTTHLLRIRKDNAIVKNITLATLTIKFVPQAFACGIAYGLRILTLPIIGSSFAFPPSALTIPIIARTVIAGAASSTIIRPATGVATIYGLTAEFIECKNDFVISWLSNGSCSPGQQAPYGCEHQVHNKYPSHNPSQCARK